MFKKTLIKIIEQNFLQQRPGNAYYSEASVQHKIALRLYVELGIESVLENIFLDDIENGNRKYLDIYSEHKKKRYGIELKYKTKKSSVNGLDYKTHSASDLGRYDFLKDIQRLEKLKSQNIIDKGFAIIITNDQGYWYASREGALCYPFRLEEGRILHGTFTPNWTARTEQIRLHGHYEIVWILTVRIQGSEPFSYCIIEI